MELFAKIKSLLGTTQETVEADGFILKKGTKVIDLKKQFNERFGSVLRVYAGRSQVDENSTLGEAGLTNEGVFECGGNLQVDCRNRMHQNALDRGILKKADEVGTEKVENLFKALGFKVVTVITAPVPEVKAVVPETPVTPQADTTIPS